MSKKKFLFWGVALLGASGVASCGRAREDGAAGGTAGVLAESGRGADGGASEGGAAGSGTSGDGGTPEPVMGGAGASSAGAGGAGASNAGSGGAAGAGGSGAAGGPPTLTMSAGCGKALPALVVPGTFSELASQPMPDGTPGFSSAPSLLVPCNATDDSANSYPPCVNGFKKRGFFVHVMPGFDNTKPSKVIYDVPGCTDASTAQGGNVAYQYQKVDGASPQQVIQVGLEYSSVKLCFDFENPKSNDFPYFGVLHQYIEENFCVDKTVQYVAGWGGVTNQMTCAYPGVLHAALAVGGSEPMSLPTCVSGHPVAGLFLHDKLDQYSPFDSALPGCSRLLQQNGCTTTTCNPSDTTTTTPVTVAAGLGTPPSISCVQFNGCPPNGQVTWCTTQLGKGAMGAAYIGEGSWITKLFWDFMSKY